MTIFNLNLFQTSFLFSLVTGKYKYKSQINIYWSIVLKNPPKMKKKIKAPFVQMCHVLRSFYT